MWGTILGSMALGAWGAAESRKALDSASREQLQQQQESLKLQREQFEKQALQAAPLVQAGEKALKDQQLMTDDPNQYRQSPYAKFLQQQSEQGMQRAAAASGGVSGGGILAMGERAQETAGAGFETQYNRLGELIRTGQSAAAGVAGAGQNFANHAGDITMKGAETRGNLSMAETGVTTGAVNQIANTGMQAYGADEQRRKFDSWTRPQPSQQQSQLQQQEAGLTTPMNNFNWSY